MKILNKWSYGETVECVVSEGACRLVGVVNHQTFTAQQDVVRKERAMTKTHHW